MRICTEIGFSSIGFGAKFVFPTRNPTDEVKEYCFSPLITPPNDKKAEKKKPKPILSQSLLNLLRFKTTGEKRVSLKVRWNLLGVNF